MGSSGSPRSLSKALLARLTAVAIAIGLLFAPAVHAAAAHSVEGAPESLVSFLVKQAPGLRAEVLRLALGASKAAAQNGLLHRSDLLTVIDYSLPSTQPRLFVFDLASRKLLFCELVAHGKASGNNLTKSFSNDPGSLATSLGLFVTDTPYFGHNGYSLRLRGLEQGFNDRALDRAIVLHGASYVSDATARLLGRLGRSWGCPAVRLDVAGKIIDTLKGGSPIFAYYPDPQWLRESRFLQRQ
jgi:L,D-transpeptidase catalytic domain